MDEDLLEDSANRIEGHLRAQGYRDADAEYQRTPRDGGLAVVFKVRRGPQFRTARVAMAGASAVPEADLRALLRTREGDLFVQAAVDSDAATLAEQYRRRGLHAGAGRPGVGARRPATPRRCPSTSRLTVTEGPADRRRHHHHRRADAVDEAALRAAITSRTGQPYYQQQVAVDRDGMLLVLLNRGYPSATIDARVVFTQDRSSAAVAFVVAEGPAGLRRARAGGRQREDQRRDDPARGDAAARRAAQLRRAHGEPAAHQRARALPPGSHHRARSRRAQPPRPAGHSRRGAGDHRWLRRRLEGGQRLRQTEPGGDATEVFEVAPRGFVEYGRRNLFGRNQSINVFARASLRTRASTTDVAEGEEEPSGYTLRDYRLLGHLPPAARPRHLQRPAGHRVPRTGAALQLQLHQARRPGRADAPAHPRAQLQRPLRDRAGQAVRGAAGPRGQAAHRPAVSSRCGCRRCRRR